MGILGPAGLLCELDQGALVGYVQAMVEHREATKLLRAEGRVIMDHGHKRLMAHPAVAMQRSAWAAIERFGKLLGLDPASRARMATMVSPPPPAPVMTRKRY